MEMGIVTELIGTVGFPMATSVMLIWVLYKQNEESKKSDVRWQDLLNTQTIEWQRVINNNTLAMNKMLHQFEEFSETNRKLTQTVVNKEVL